MTPPKINLDDLPDLERTTGVYGSTSIGGGTNDDRVIAVMIYVYNTASNEGLTDY